MNKVAIISPNLSGKSSQGAVNDPGITYNQSGITFNEANYTFGGFYGYSDVFPIFAALARPIPFLSGQNTNAILTDQNITFNEAGISFNEAGYSFGGVSNENLIYPIFSLASSPTPRIVGYADIYRSPAPYAGIPIGPGFFLFITYS